MRAFTFIAIVLLSCDQSYKKTYYEDGSLKSKSTSLENALNGEIVSYYKSGQIKTHITWKDGQNNKTIRQYFENGKLEQISKRLNGLFEGEVIRYYPNGSVRVRGTFKRGFEVGAYRVFEEKGALSEFELFDENSRVYYVTLWKNGVKEREIFFPLINIRAVSDSIDAEIVCPIKFKGTGFITLGTKVKEEFKPLSPRIQLKQTDDHIRIPGTVDPDFLYYRFDFNPSPQDTLIEIGIQIKVMQEKDSAVSRKDFRFLLSEASSVVIPSTLRKS